MRISRAVAAALALAIIPGCAGDGPDARTVVRFLEAPDAGGGWAEIVARFETVHPEIDVELIEGPASTNTREEMYTAGFLAADSAYDAIYMDVVWVPKFASHGWLRALDDLLTAEERRRFLPGDIQASIYDGRLYRVPMQADAGMLYYRTDLVSEAPETFEDLVAVARRVQAPPGLWGLVFQGLQYEGLVCTFLEVLWGHGGDVLDPQGRVILDRPEAILALEWMTGVVQDIAPEGVTTYQEEEARHAFQEGRAVFMRNWPYAWTKLQEAGSPVKGKVGIAPMVRRGTARSAATLGGWGFGIAATSPNPEATWAFIEFATRAEQQKILHFRNGRIPTRVALFEDPQILRESPHYTRLFEILRAARPRPVHPMYAEISAVLQAHLSAALVGATPPDAALREAADRIRAMIGS